jgi:periplasmic divalent cation tolerance protein
MDLSPSAPRKDLPMTDHIQIVTTTETEEDARRIALALVEGRLAACVQVLGPTASTYRWQGKIETAAEWQCVAKTRTELFARVEEAIVHLHPYEVPEILAVPIVAENAGYAQWLDEQVDV